MFRWILVIFLFLAALLGLAIGVLNADVVTLDLIAFEASLPLGALVLATLAVGVLLGLFLFWLLFWMPGRLRVKQPVSQVAAEPARNSGARQSIGNGHSNRRDVVPERHV